MHVGLLSVGHHGDRAFQDERDAPLRRVALRERDARGAGGDDAAGKPRGLAVVRRQHGLRRQRGRPVLGPGERVQAVGVDHRRGGLRVPQDGYDEVVRPGGVRETRTNEQRADLLGEQRRELSGGAGRDDAGLRLREREERDVGIAPRDPLHHRSRGRHRHDARAATGRGARGDEHRAGVAVGPADDEHPAARFLPRVRR